MQIYTDNNGVQQWTAGEVCVETDTEEPVYTIIWDTAVDGGEIDPAKVGGYSRVNDELVYSQETFDANSDLIETVAQAESDAFKVALRDLFNDAVEGSTPEGFATRTMLLTILDETNRLRAWITSFKAAVAAATSLGNLQTRVAALNNMPEIQPAQMKTELTNKANSGLAD